MVAASLAIDRVSDWGPVASEMEEWGSIGTGKKICGAAAEVLRDACAGARDGGHKVVGWRRV